MHTIALDFRNPHYHDAFSMRILNAISGGYLLVDRNKTVVFANEWILQRLPCAASTLPGSLTEIVRRDRSFRFLRAVEDCLNRGHSAFLSHYLNRQPLDIRHPGSNDLIPHSISILPLPGEIGDERYCLIESKDVSIELQREIKLRKKSAELEKLSEDLSHIVYAASHDLQTPMRTIRSLLDMFAEDEEHHLRPQGKDYINEIKGATQRAMNLMHQLLEWSKAQEKQDAVWCTDLAKVSSEVSDDFKHDLTVLEGELIFGEFATVMIEETRARRLLQNLISNSINYRSELSPRIEVSSVKRNDMLEISVKDNGIGIDPEFRERVFGMFSRLHRYDERAGSGIGLPICRKIVEDAGGAIWIEPSVLGCDIRFTLPLAES